MCRFGCSSISLARVNGMDACKVADTPAAGTETANIGGVVLDVCGLMFSKVAYGCLAMVR
jgi:hypothetical protein